MPEDYRYNNENDRARRLAKIGMAPPTQNTQNISRVSSGRTETPRMATVQKPAQRPNTSAQRPAHRPAAQAQNTARPSSRTNQEMPPRRNVRSVSQENTIKNANVNSVYGRNGNNRPAPRITSPSQRIDSAADDRFTKTLSDDESRAMMFALTGRAEKPLSGGEVDIIDAGKMPSGKKKINPVRRAVSTTENKSKTGKYIGRFFFVILSLILFVVVTAYATIFVIAHGPSESMRDLLVMSAEQASATKWVPYLVLSKDTVHGIINKSEEVVQDEISIEDYNKENKDSGEKSEDEWANAKDEGVILDIVKGSTYKAYVLLVKDPSRVFVGTSTDDFANATAGVNIFQAAARYDALACINGGEFLDNGGHGSGYAPLGLTFSKGECVFDDGSVKTFMGFTSDNKLIVRESMTVGEAKELGIRDAVSFQNGNTLIEKNGDKLVMYYEDSNTGTSQRSAIGQREDGTVIMIVTDGRTASSLGATHNDMIDLMVSYGAVSAGMLDGGSSAMMYYDNYFEKFGIDASTLDEYQAQGLVNNYKAFTEPRRIPSFFMVSK